MRHASAPSQVIHLETASGSVKSVSEDVLFARGSLVTLALLMRMLIPFDSALVSSAAMPRIPSVVEVSPGSLESVYPRQ